MAPVIDIVRHAEARHNVEGNHIRDPSLTDKGVAQAEGLQKMYPHMDQVGALISSPLRRAIQTTCVAFEPLVMQKAIPILLVPNLQEASARPSDTGSPWQELDEEFGLWVDLDLLYEGEWYKDTTGTYGPDPQRVAERARKARVYIRELARNFDDDEHIVVVTHSQFVRVLIEGQPDFGNAEFRSCQFADLLGDDDQAILREINPASSNHASCIVL
ncbi:histidine phosphatase superfamily [Nemania serpens]|nr:histidine phosphatase superfamily [Nemania serpens]